MVRFVLSWALVGALPGVFAEPPSTVAKKEPAPPPKLTFNFEFRMRYEAREGVSFGRDPDQGYPLFRTRLGAIWRPNSWIKVTALAQDARSPLYGSPAPGNLRDTLDLQEGYVELGHKLGTGGMVGRQMQDFGETRLIGSPQWLNTARTWDSLRIWHKTRATTFQGIFLSVVKVRQDAENRPVLGDRIWGTYNTHRALIPKGEVEWYVLRHDQNRPGGFTGPGTRMGVNLFGTRVVTPLPLKTRLSIEAIGQTGKVGGRQHRAAAWYSSLSRRVDLGKPVDFSVEYKYASGTNDPQGGRSATFDQLYPANHDKFGHADLFGWKNIRNLRSLETINMSKTWRIMVMYDAVWLASKRDALYNGPGRVIAWAPRGDAGRYVGQEIDAFTTYSRGHFRFGGGVAKLFAGEFLKNTTPGASTFFAYFFQGISF